MCASSMRARRDAIGVAATPREQAWVNRRLEVARRRLGASTYAGFEQQGRALSQDAVIKLALQRERSDGDRVLAQRDVD